MDKRDASMIRRDVAFLRECDKHTLRDPRTTREAARWLLACQFGATRMCVYTLPARAPYQLGIPDPADPLMYLTLHVCERDIALVIAARVVEEGVAIWREGVTTRKEPDLVLAQHAADGLAREIGAWILWMRGEQEADAIERAYPKVDDIG